MARRNINSAAGAIKRRTIQKKVDGGALSPEETLHKQHLACFLRAGTYTNSQIADALGVTRGTVRKWFEDKDVQKFHQEILESLSTAAKQFLETLTIEAVKRLAELMYDADHKIALDAVREILDRGGIPKSSRVEHKGDPPSARAPAQPESHQVEILIRTPEDADKYAELVKEAEAITAAEAEEKK